MLLTDLAPKKVWYYFNELTKIPRPSHHEAAVEQYILDEAQRLGLWAEKDAAGNVLVRKPASAGNEQKPGVILQGHLDMVAQKNQATMHDFEKDPINAYVDGEWVTADGTTLGADDGIGVASALAILASDDLVHGPLEALFTATEETGMDGAQGLQGGWLKGDLLLNLDSEQLGEICIGCAGGVDGTFTLPVARDAAPQGQAYSLILRGLKGGHSGMDIIKQRGNAIKILNRVVSALYESDGVAIAYFEGGSLRNAIPREAEAVIISDKPAQELASVVQSVLAEIKVGLPEEDKQLQVNLAESEAHPSLVWNVTDARKALAAIALCNDGVDRMSMDVPGLVETSVNLAKLSDDGEKITLECLLRSLNDAARDDLGKRMCQLFKLAGGEGKLSGAYPGWQPLPGAKLTEVVEQEGEKLLGYTPKIQVIHAGLECGLMSRNYPNWEMVSFGPTIQMPHSPDERVNIKSVGVFYEWLCNVLAALAK